MLLNDTTKDVRTMMQSVGMTQADVADKLGCRPQNVSGLFHLRKKPLVSKALIQVMEAMGYDIEIKYVKRMG